MSNSNYQEQYPVNEIVEDIQKVSLQNSEIYDVASLLFIEYRELAGVDKSINYFKKFKNNEQFTSIINTEGQISIVLGLQAATLDENIPYKEIVDALINDEQLDKSLMSVSLNFNERKHIKLFLYFFRKELFNSVFVNNELLNQVSFISEKILNERIDYFNRKSCNE